MLVMLRFPVFVTVVLSFGRSPILLDHDIVGVGTPDAAQAKTGFIFSSTMTDFGLMMNLGRTTNGRKKRLLSKYQLFYQAV
jgi:hypothetical protein